MIKWCLGQRARQAVGEVWEDEGRLAAMGHRVDVENGAKGWKGRSGQGSSFERGVCQLCVAHVRDEVESVDHLCAKEASRQVALLDSLALGADLSRRAFAPRPAGQASGSDAPAAPPSVDCGTRFWCFSWQIREGVQRDYMSAASATCSERAEGLRRRGAYGKRGQTDRNA